MYIKLVNVFKVACDKLKILTLVKIPVLEFTDHIGHHAFSTNRPSREISTPQH